MVAHVGTPVVLAGVLPIRLSMHARCGLSNTQRTSAAKRYIRACVRLIFSSYIVVIFVRQVSGYMSTLPLPMLLQSPSSDHSASTSVIVWGLTHPWYVPMWAELVLESSQDADELPRRRVEVCCCNRNRNCTALPVAHLPSTAAETAPPLPCQVPADHHPDPYLTSLSVSFAYQRILGDH